MGGIRIAYVTVALVVSAIVEELTGWGTGMKVLDKYITKNFLIGYAIAFSVLIGLRIIIDLFVNLDEFTEHADLGTLAVIKNISTFYALNITLYFRDFAGMITVVAAAFSLGKMVRTNELVAVMSSGVSLKRVIGPIVFLSLVLTVVLVIDQEFIIPPLGDKLVRSQDDIPGQESYDVWFISDSKGSLICSQRFDVKTATLHKPTIITRTVSGQSDIWDTTGRISAERAIYNEKSGCWDLIEGWFSHKDSRLASEPIFRYESDIGPKDIPVRRKSGNKTLLSSRQLAMAVSHSCGAEDKDQRPCTALQPKTFPNNRTDYQPGYADDFVADSGLPGS
ncbi:MAG: LptF/LptG family permease [Planctomycetota bacterium]